MLFVPRPIGNLCANGSTVQVSPEDENKVFGNFAFPGPGTPDIPKMIEACYTLRLLPPFLSRNFDLISLNASIVSVKQWSLPHGHQKLFVKWLGKHGI